MPVPLEYAADAPLLSVSAPLLVTTASSQVTVMEIVSPTPYAPSPVVSATLARSGASPSISTSPRSPEAAPAAPPAASAMVPVYAETATSVSDPSPSATVVVKTSEVVPDPLEYAAESPLSRVSAPLLVTTASPHVHVIVRVSPTP